MSLSDFLVQRILGLKSPTQSQDKSEQQDAITATVPKTSAQLQNFYNVISANSMTDYATALQIMQLQMFCQPSLLNSFLNQITALRLAMNNSNLTKTSSLTQTPANVCDVPLRERKRATSRGYDELPQKRPKITRRLHDDSETCSPVSGMFIKEASSLPPADELQAAADLDETAVFVNVSEETRRKIEQITNVIGDCICALCKVRYDDVFRLAQHRCPRIIHEEYRCPECDKVFSCPANLASHRRWHKPRGAEAVPSSSSIFPSSSSFLCPMCSATFDSKKAFKLHSSRCPTVSTSESNPDQNPLLQLLQRSIS